MAVSTHLLALDALTARVGDHLPRQVDRVEFTMSNPWVWDLVDEPRFTCIAYDRHDRPVPLPWARHPLVGQLGEMLADLAIGPHYTVYTPLRA